MPQQMYIDTELQEPQQPSSGISSLAFTIGISAYSANHFKVILMQF